MGNTHQDNYQRDNHQSRQQGGRDLVSWGGGLRDRRERRERRGIGRGWVAGVLVWGVAVAGVFGPWVGGASAGQTTAPVSTLVDARGRELELVEVGGFGRPPVFAYRLVESARVGWVGSRVTMTEGCGHCGARRTVAWSGPWSGRGSGNYWHDSQGYGYSRYGHGYGHGYGRSYNQGYARGFRQGNRQDQDVAFVLVRDRAARTTRVG